MTSIKLAIKNIVRVKGRSILIGIIMTLISISVLVSLSIKSGTEETLKETRGKLGNDVTLEVNTQNMQKKIIENMKEGKESSDIKIDRENLTETMAEKYTKSKYVKDYDYVKEATLVTDSKVVGEQNNTNSKIQSPQNLSGNSGNIEMPELKLVGNLNPKYQEEFKEGNKSIVDGRFYTEEEVKNGDNVVVISKNLADLNDLKVGDSIEVESVNKEKKVNLKIVGLYEDNVQQATTIPIAFMYRDNEIYSPITTVKKSFSNEQDNNIDKANYFIDDPKNIEAFKEEVKNSKLDFEKFTLDANDDEYTKMAAPLEKLNSVIKIFLIIVVITGAAIMILLMTMITRERKQEVGILRSLGVKRGKIAFQFIIETLIIVSISLGLGVLAGKTVSQKTADYLLQREIAMEQKMEQEKSNPLGNVIFMNGSSSNEEKVDPIDKIETKVSTNEILTLIGIGLFISSFGSIVTSYWIMKYEPMKILNNRV